MTKEDFMLSIVGSIVATILCQLGFKSAVYLRSKPFRKARRRFVRNTSAWGREAIEQFPALKPALAITFIVLFLISFITVQYINHISQGRITAEMAKVQPIPRPISYIESRVKNIAEMKPCLIDDSVEESRNSHEQASLPARPITLIECRSLD